MKKVLIILLLLCLSLPVFASDWLEIFEKQYIHLTSIEVDYVNNTIHFWIKKLRKNPKETIEIEQGKKVPYWYSMSHWNIDCTNRKERIDVIAVYDLQNQLIYSDEYTPDWQAIVPETYSEGFYRLFCLVPFQENPLLKTTP